MGKTEEEGGGVCVSACMCVCLHMCVCVCESQGSLFQEKGKLCFGKDSELKRVDGIM